MKWLICFLIVLAMAEAASAQCVVGVLVVPPAIIPAPVVIEAPVIAVPAIVAAPVVPVVPAVVPVIPGVLTVNRKYYRTPMRDRFFGRYRWYFTPTVVAPVQGGSQ